MNFNNMLIAEAQAELQTSRCGFIASQHLADIVDHTLSSDFNAHAEDAELALLAVGGYGRREIAPFSDIDIMILTGKRDSIASGTAEKILYCLWDRGINISHSFRTIPEAVEDAIKDLQTRTSLIDSRFLAGNEVLWRKFLNEGYHRIINKNKGAFVRDLFAEVARRYKTYSPSLYQLEPNIKEGRGGLRDIHTMLWLCRITMGIRSINDLQGLLQRNEFRQFKRACEFVLRSRLYLHILSHSKNEVLSFQYQEGLAGLIGFRRTNRFSASEIFMRVYYRHTRTIMDTLRKVINLSDQRVFQRFPQLFTKKITDNFYLSKGEIILSRSAKIDRPEILLEAFYAYSVTRREFSHLLQNEIRKRHTLIGRERPLCPRAIGIFKEILSGSRVYDTLCEMHRLNILDRVIPDFGRLRHLVIHEPYHRYTVDEHTLRAIKYLESLIEGRQQRHPLLNQIGREIDPTILYLTLLLHDIGKGISGDSLKHEEEGYKRIRTILEHLDMDRESRRLIEFLVKNHLLLSRSALKRDTEATETIIWVADMVKNEQNLKALLLVTCADMSAVNPDFFTDWKAHMLFDLYIRVMDHIKGTTRVLNLSEDIKSFVSTMPDNYLISTPLTELNRDSEVFYRAIAEGPVVDIREMASGTAELIVVAHDAKCLFLNILQQIGQFGLNIVRARLYPANNDMVLDKITLSNWNTIEWDGLGETLSRNIKDAILSGKKILGGITTDNYREQLKGGMGRFPSHLISLEPFVEIDNEASDSCSIVEVFAADRIGLLYDIASIFTLFDIDIVSAMINTEDKVAQDVFYIKYKEGQIDGDRAKKLIDALRYIVS